MHCRFFPTDFVQGLLSLVVTEMPPKKKQKLTTNVKGSSGAALTMGDVSPFQVKLRDWVTQVYSLRHGAPEALPWPIEGGGSILSVCQRCWKDQAGLVAGFCDLVQKVGIASESMTPDVFEEKFMTSQEWDVHWSFVEELFWNLLSFVAKVWKHCHSSFVATRSFLPKRDQCWRLAFFSGALMTAASGVPLQWLLSLTSPKALL